jgi:hypothetical protein
MLFCMHWGNTIYLSCYPNPLSRETCQMGIDKIIIKKISEIFQAFYILSVIKLINYNAGVF